MTTTTRISPRPPVGAYPQLRLWDHRGRAPRSARIRTTINIVPSMVAPLSVKGAPLSRDAPSPLLRDWLAQASRGRVHRVANSFTGDEEFNSAVLLAPSGIVVRGDRQSITEASGRNRLARYSFLHQVVAHRAGPIFRQCLVHCIAADVVRITADFDVKPRVSQQDTCNFRQLLARPRLQGILPGVKQDIRHADDESACRIASLKNRIQLLG